MFSKFLFSRLKTYFWFFIISIYPTHSWSQELNQFPSKYPNQIGDIYFNKEIDTTEFEPCKRNQIIHWYTYEVKYKGDSKAIYDECLNSILPDQNNQFTGYIIVRFVVNCKGKTGWFRANALTTDFLPVNCPKVILDKFIIYVKNLKGWKNANYEGVNYDSYMYLNFKLINGKIINILPLI
jgi:hypothetical protein